MGPYTSLSSEIGGWALIGAWGLKEMNMVSENSAKFPLELCSSK